MQVSYCRYRNSLAELVPALLAAVRTAQIMEADAHALLILAAAVEACCKAKAAGLYAQMRVITPSDGNDEKGH